MSDKPRSPERTDVSAANGHDDSRPKAATAVGSLAIAGVVGAVVMSLAHLGIDLGFIEAARLLPVAIGFAVGALLFALVAYGALRRTAWAWPLAVVVNGLAFVSSIFPVRGPEALVPALVTLAALVILLSRPGRDALLRRISRGSDGVAVSRGDRP